MRLGERIRECRLLRGFTQEALGIKLGYTEKNASNRVAQYESGYRVPKEATLNEIAKILNVSIYNFIQPDGDKIEEVTIKIMEFLFWEDDRFQKFVQLTKMTPCNDGTENMTENYHIDYDTDKTYTNIRFRGALINNCLDEWHDMMHKEYKGTVTDKEYREWKYTWPESSKYRLEFQ